MCLQSTKFRDFNDVFEMVSIGSISPNRVQLFFSTRACLQKIHKSKKDRRMLLVQFHCLHGLVRHRYKCHRVIIHRVGKPGRRCPLNKKRKRIELVYLSVSFMTRFACSNDLKKKIRKLKELPMHK